MKGYNGLRMMALMFVVVATMVLGACREEEDKDVFTVYIDGYNGGKDYMGGLDIFWNEGDRVRINNGIYTVDIDESDHNKATINAEGVTTYGGAYYAAYPADMSSIGLDGTITFDMPAEEIYATDAGGRQRVQNIMAATTDNHQLTFAPLGALLHFSVASSASGARLCSVEVESDKAACGTMTATHSDAGWNFTPPSPALPTNMKRTLRFSTPEAVGAAAKDFYLVVAPMTEVSSFTLRFVFENAAGDVKVFEKTKSGTTFDIAKGSIYRFVTSFDGTNISVAGESVSAATMDGTASHPYLVCSQRSWERTMSLNASNAAKYIALANDIQVATTVAEFKAKLDGCGHTITLTTDSIPLFNKINGATVSNLTLATLNPITSPVCYDNSFGLLACKALASGTGCEVSNCTNTADITFNVGDLSNRYVGGLVGNASGCSFTSNHNTGTIISDATYIGGIAGYASNAAIMTNNTNRGNIIYRTTASISQPASIGGIAGSQSGNINVSGCINDGDILIEGITSGIVKCGGIVGESLSSFVGCSNYGTIRCNNSNSNSKIVGGIVGFNNTIDERNMINCFNEGDIEAIDGVSNMLVGGLVCDEMHLNISNCYAYCNLKGTNVAGLVWGNGQHNNSIIKNCYYYGTINATHTYGLVGVQPASNKYTITHCFYKAGYNMRSGTNASDSENDTIKADDPLTLSDESALVAALNSGAASITGARSWTTSNGHVVLVQE
ncbi:MAG: hypothetical protein IKJ81_07985 [Bacteroidales bacterium]|nr:hypothetical protein [Bacteroidales bacterium]